VSLIKPAFFVFSGVRDWILDIVDDAVTGRNVTWQLNHHKSWWLVVPTNRLTDVVDSLDVNTAPSPIVLTAEIHSCEQGHLGDPAKATHARP
jgi:hypothetical protein